MVGGTVSRVAVSQHPDFNVGDWVLGYDGWQDYALSDGSGLRNLGPHLPRPSACWACWACRGLPLTWDCSISANRRRVKRWWWRRQRAVGSVVGQIGKLKGCRVVGVAGGAEKCRYVVEELGFDACIDHRAPDFAEQLAAACPQGIDIYYENVGGAVFDAVLPLLNAKARIPVCGIIAHYNATGLPAGPDRLPLLEGLILRKRIRMQGFIIFDDYGSRFDEFLQQMSSWVEQGKIKFREDIVDGLEQAPQAFIGLLQGQELRQAGDPRRRRVTGNRAWYTTPCFNARHRRRIAHPPLPSASPAR